MGTSVRETSPDADERETASGAASPAPAARSAPPPVAAPPPSALPPDADDDPPEEGAPAWMTTFGDMMSLLLTFFILLFSMSTVEVEKFRIAAESIREGLGNSTSALLDGQSPLSSLPPDSTLTLDALQRRVDQELDSIAGQLERFVERNNLEEKIVVDREEDGVYVRIQDAAVFPPGAAIIEDENRWIIEQLGDVAMATDVPVVVSGHTDDTPVRPGGPFPTNWELSAARASGVARALVARGHDPTGITVEAFGEYRPIAENETAEGRTQNRRVDLFYSKETIEHLVRHADSTAAAAAAASDTTGTGPGP